MANKINQTAKVEVFPLPAEQPLIIGESIEKQQKGVNLNTNTQLQLEKIKQELESGKPSIGFIKEILENIDTFSSENKPFILGGIFGLLNQSDIGIKSLSGNKISLSQGKSQNSETQNQYESLLNNAISARKINIRDIHNALLARTFSSLEEYNNTKFENSPKSSFDYAKFLLKKYGISIEVSDSTPDDIKEKIKNDSSQKAYFENISFESQEKYENFISIIKSQTQNNSADRDFLVGFFDDFYHNKGENISKNSIVEISQTQNKNKAKILKEIGVFSDEQKATLGIDSEKTQEDFIKKISSDPLGAISDGFKGGAGAVALIFGLIGAIFGGKKGFGIGALLGFFTGMGGAEWLWDKGKEKLNKKQNKKGETSSDTPPDGNEIPKQNISIYTKYEGLIKGISSEKKEQARYLEVWKTLSSNDKLMNSKISEIPIHGTLEEKRKFFVEYCGFDSGFFIQNNSKIQKIFTTILEERENSIGKYHENETLKEYLERTNSANAGAISVVGTGEGEKQENIEKLDKNEILGFFNIDSNIFESISNELNTLNLNLLSFLNSFKNFIENNLGGLDIKIKNKIIKSISLKTGGIIGIISKLKDEEVKNYGNLDNFKNNRWIVNNEIKNLYGDITNKILPSAYFLTKYDTKNQYSKDQLEKIKRVKEMFESDITNTGDFDKNFWSKQGFGEFYDSSINNWEVFDISTEKDFDFLQGLGLNTDNLEEISLLSDEDKEIESKVMFGYMAGLAVLLANDAASFTGIWTIPGAIFGAGYGVTDAFKSEDLMLTILKELGVAPDEFRMDKKWYDNVLAGVGAIPLAGQAIRGGLKAKKLAAFINKLSPEKLSEFNKLKGEIFSKISSKIPGFKASKEIVQDTRTFGVDIEKINKLKVGERITESRIINGEKVELTLKKGNKDNLMLESLTREGGEELRGAKGLTWLRVNSVTKLTHKETIFLNNLLESRLSGLRKGDDIKIGEIKISFTDHGEYRIIKGNEQKIFKSKKEVIEYIGPENVKKDLLANKVPNYIRQRNINKLVEIDGHKIRIEDNNFIVTDKSGNILSGEKLKEFLDKNIFQILKKYGINIEKIPSDTRLKINNLVQKIDEFVGRNPSFLNNSPKIKFIFNEFKRPITSTSGLLDTLLNTPGLKGKSNEILRLLITGDRNALFNKAGTWGRMGLLAGASGFGLVFDDEMGEEDLVEYISYAYLGIIWGIFTDREIQD